MVIEDIRNAFLSGVPIEYKAHCLKRMLERNISRNDIKNCVVFGEIIEDYPLDDNNPFEASFPACLISWVDSYCSVPSHALRCMAHEVQWTSVLRRPKRSVELRPSVWIQPIQAIRAASVASI